MLWNKQGDLCKALDNLHDIFQTALEETGYDYEEDPLEFRLVWCREMIKLHMALNDLENEYSHKVAKEIYSLEKEIVKLKK